MRDPLKFSDFIHTQKKDPRNNLPSSVGMWDFWSLCPESLHQVTILFSDRGTPYGYRHMHGYGSHTFSMINDNDERFYVKFHFLTQQGVKNFGREEATKMAGEDPDFATRDLWEAIERKEYPKWKAYIQVAPQAEAEKIWGAFDLTKVTFLGIFIEYHENIRVNFAEKDRCGVRRTSLWSSLESLSSTKIPQIISPRSNSPHFLPPTLFLEYRSAPTRCYRED